MNEVKKNFRKDLFGSFEPFYSGKKAVGFIRRLAAEGSRDPGKGSPAGCRLRIPVTRVFGTGFSEAGRGGAGGFLEDRVERRQGIEARIISHGHHFHGRFAQQPFGLPDAESVESTDDSGISSRP